MSFSFGTPSSAPATGLSGGFSFGANKPATPGFGLGAAAQPSTGLFGTPATSAPAFGTATPAFGSTPAFGATSTAPAFGATNTFGATNPPAFGATSTAPTFGAGAAPAFGAAATPAFGATSTAPTFGAGATPAFGTAATPAFGATSAAPAFGTTATPAFGATSTPAFGATTTPSFGATTAPSFGTSLGTGGLSFGTATTTTASTGLSFGAPAITTSAGLGGLGGFGFGATTTTTTASTGQWAFGSTSTATTSASIFGAKLDTTNVTGTQPSVSATPSLGLGGVAPTGTTTTTTDGKSEPPKQAKLPNEIQTTVDSFKEFIKKQKMLSSDIMRASVKPLYKVSRSAETTLGAALALGGEAGRARAQSRRLRAAAAAALAAAEGAARDATGIDPEGSSPPVYVKDLIAELEQQLITFRRQMDVADKQMQSSPKLLTEQEVTLGIRRMHESLVALAARLQAVHAQVRAQRDQYQNLRKYILKDATDALDDLPPNASLDQILRDAEGSRKKTKTGQIADIGIGSAVLSDPRAALGSLQHLAGPTPFTYLSSTLSPYPTIDATGTNWQPQQQSSVNTSLNLSGFGSTAPADNTGFQLQKPPGKRGKQ